MPAFHKAIEVGVDIIETDIKVSKDGIPFLMHDKSLVRTTNGEGNPEDFTLAELKTLYLKDAEGRLTSERIPTLEELLVIAKDKVYIDLDFKTNKLDPVIDLIKRTGMSSQVFFFKADVAALDHVMLSNSDHMIMPRARSRDQTELLLQKFQPELLHIDHGFYEPSVTSLIKKKGTRIWINALGTPDELLRSGKTEEGLNLVLNHGANVIQTDEADLLLRLLKEKGLRP
jgi:glycerophosphoryl diester phosphodiesterase